METIKILMSIAVVAVLAAAVGLFVNLGFLANLSSVGQVSTDIGNASLSVQGIADIVFIKNLINWSTGQVDDSQAGCGPNSPAILTAIFPSISNPSVKCGTWQVQSGLTLQNRGNTPVMVKLRSNNNATAGVTGPFIGSGSGLNLVYDWRVANNQTNSCNPSTGNLGPTVFTPVNYTTGAVNGTIICANFSNINNATHGRQLNIEFNVTIPTDAVIGTKLSQITAEAFVI